MSYIITLLIISLVILAHELGHFLAARWVKMPIKIFSIGFGPPLWEIERGETKYRLSLIPLGGYVMPAIEDEEDFFKFPLRTRVIMTLGGPLASLILPLFCFAIFNTAGAGLSIEGLLIKPFLQVFTILFKIVTALPHLFSSPGQLSGIVSVVAQGGDYIGMNPLNSLRFLAVLSLNLAVLNMLPIPALDGGKLLLYLLEKINRRFVRLHFPLAVAGWIFILGLLIYVTVSDIGRLINPAG